MLLFKLSVFNTAEGVCPYANLGGPKAVHFKDLLSQIFRRPAAD